LSKLIPYFYHGKRLGYLLLKVSKNCQKKTITQEPEIRPIWSPWSEAARVLLKSTLHCSLAVAVVANVRQKNLLSD
jgi:hypothetical protein